MNLTSIQRLRRYIQLDDNLQNNQLLNFHLFSVSKNIENYLNREILNTTYTEYFDVINSSIEYSLKAYPIDSITTVDSDSTGLYTGSESTQTDFYVGSYDRTVVLDSPISQALKGLRVVYTGGMSTTTSLSTYNMTIAGTFTSGNFVTGATSGAVGILQATYTGTAEVQVNVLYGIFQVGETLTTQSTEGGADLGANTATINSATTVSLVELFPEVAMACEMQVRYNWKHMNDFEDAGITKDGTSFQSAVKEVDYSNRYHLRREVRNMLNSFRRLSL